MVHSGGSIQTGVPSIPRHNRFDSNERRSVCQRLPRREYSLNQSRLHHSKHIEFVLAKNAEMFTEFRMLQLSSSPCCVPQTGQDFAHELAPSRYGRRGRARQHQHLRLLPLVVARRHEDAVKDKYPAAFRLSTPLTIGVRSHYNAPQSQPGTANIATAKTAGQPLIAEVLVVAFP